MIKNCFFHTVILIFLLTILGLPVSGSTPEAPPTSQGGSHKAEASPVAHETEHKEPGLLDFNIGILISQTLNFFVLLFILKKFLYGPINQILEARKKQISENIQLADTRVAEANDLKLQYEEKLKNITEQAYQIKQQAISEAQQAKEEILSGAKDQASTLIEKAGKELTRERQKAWVELRQEVANISLLVAEKIIDKSLDEKTHHDLIKNMILQLEKPQ